MMEPTLEANCFFVVFIWLLIIDLVIGLFVVSVSCLVSDKDILID